METDIWYRLSRRLPEKFQDNFIEKIKKAGFKQDAHEWLGKSLVLVIFFTVLGGIVFYYGEEVLNIFIQPLFPATEIPLFVWVLSGLLVGFVSSAGIRWLQLYYRIEKRRQTVEDILPDFLLMVAGNIRAGMTSFSAFKGSARPEFGALSKEIHAITSRSLGVESFSNALSKLSNTIQSKSLNETIRFFLQAVRSGGKLARLLENTAVDLRKTQDLKKELQSSTKTYVIFVAFVMVIATPLLMAVAIEFVDLIANIQSQNQLGGAVETSAVGFLGGAITINSIFLTSIAYLLLLGNAILGSLFMGTIGQNRPLLGLRFAPIMFIVSLVMLWVGRIMLGGMLGTP
jgi:pilus assembly protein TadC